MFDARKMGGGYTTSLYHQKKGGKALTVLVSFLRLPAKGGQRWNKEVTPYG